MTTKRDVRPEKIRCDACPVMCYIAEGKSGACDRYANQGGRIIVRLRSADRASTGADGRGREGGARS